MFSDDPQSGQSHTHTLIQREATIREEQRLIRLLTVARMAEQALEALPLHGIDSGGAQCNCAVCVLRASVSQLEPGDI